MRLKFYLLSVLALGVTVMTAAGCPKASTDADPKATQTAAGSAKETHRHEGWWCDEHGVPEEVCALCDTKLVATFKSKGDWCEKHNRPDSQCFTCHPEKETEFAAEYEARYGKKPPKPKGA